MIKRIFDFISSLRLTIYCLSACLLLVFAGTIAQMHLDIHTVQERYFQSVFIWWQGPSGEFKIPVFPGGHLLGGILLVNLIGAHIKRFRWKLSHLGIQLTHGGLIVMLAGGLLTDLFSVESHMRVATGQTQNYSEASLDEELAVIDHSDPSSDLVTAIPSQKLRHGGVISHPGLPFSIVTRKFYENSRLAMLDQAAPDSAPAASQGLGSRIAVSEAPAATAQDEANASAAVIEILPAAAGSGPVAASLGTWLVSEALGSPQTFSFGGKTWELSMRRARYYKPYTVTLKKFTHEVYPGTQTPKNFASTIELSDPKANVSREVLIYMNHPFRYSGDTYYQSGMDDNGAVSILQVVHNPSFVTPYVGCLIVGAGLIIQFAYHLVKFGRRRNALAV
jgi:hypothetical protein